MEPYVKPQQKLCYQTKKIEAWIILRPCFDYIIERIQLLNDFLKQVNVYHPDVFSKFSQL